MSESLRAEHVYDASRYLADYLIAECPGADLTAALGQLVIASLNGYSSFCDEHPDQADEAGDTLLLSLGIIAEAAARIGDRLIPEHRRDELASLAFEGMRQALVLLEIRTEQG